MYDYFKFSDIFGTENQKPILDKPALKPNNFGIVTSLMYYL